MYVSLGLRLKPQNLPSHNEWFPNWWGIRAFKFSCSLFLSPAFLAKIYFKHFCMCKMTVLLSWYLFLHAVHRDFSQCFSGHDSYQTFFQRDIEFIFYASYQSSVTISFYTLYRCTLGSKFTPIKPPVLSMSLALPVWMHTHLCFLTGRPGLFLCHHLHTPQVLWLTTVLTTFLPYFGLLMKKVWANKIMKEIMSSKCIREQNLFFCHTV